MFGQNIDLPNIDLDSQDSPVTQFISNHYRNASGGYDFKNKWMMNLLKNIPEIMLRIILEFQSPMNQPEDVYSIDTRLAEVLNNNFEIKIECIYRLMCNNVRPEVLYSCLIFNIMRADWIGITSDYEFEDNTFKRLRNRVNSMLDNMDEYYARPFYDYNLQLIISDGIAGAEEGEGKYMYVTGPFSHLLDLGDDRITMLLFDRFEHVIHYFENVSFDDTYSPFRLKVRNLDTEQPSELEIKIEYAAEDADNYDEYASEFVYAMINLRTGHIFKRRITSNNISELNEIVIITRDKFYNNFFDDVSRFMIPPEDEEEDEEEDNAVSQSAVERI